MAIGLDLPGYSIIEQLYVGTRTLVYRGICEADQQPVVIKLLRNQHPSFSELVQFHNQYAITHPLDIPGIIKPYRLEPYRNGYALVMEDFGGISLRHFTQGRSLTLEQFQSIALQLVDILHPLHQQRIIHKDIKPANILIHPDRLQVRLIDFSIASLLPRETQEIQNPSGLEGTLAYLSPEQTGRMNRGIDYRSDFYSLGVTLFELLTGQLPFQSSDPMELLHCHLAQQPPSICDLNADLPLMLGEIIRKLMAKNAEDRYQSAIGLKHDLMKCQEEWLIAGQRIWFELGQADVSDRFLIPEKLYGREQEVRTLLEAFGRVANGAAELMLVAGFSGIGKTAIVNEVHKPIVRWNGYFIKGKYDQFNRNIPFSAVVQALRDLMGQLLSESDAQLAQWQAKILQAVGENGQVLTEVIPELEQIIGKQPLAPALSGSAAQNRFNRLFQKLIHVFATLEHPLVMFLDDLQWADSASLNLMQGLISQGAGHLLLIGAYRDNEVFPAHPLMLTLGEIAKTAATFNTLTLTPLSQADVNYLIADTLSCSIALAMPLTELVDQKTKGNPFFATQFLKALHQEGDITYDPRAAHWQCDLATVKLRSITDDVVEFMALQLQKLPIATQDVIKLAACIGAQFDLGTLAIVSEQSPEDAAIALWSALQEGLIVPTTEVYKFFTQSDRVSVAHVAANPTYRFLHDRVQQAAHALIPDDRKQITHLQIGRLLQQAAAGSEPGELLFTIVNHLNQGASLMEDEPEQQELVQLNQLAGQKAKSATAYAAALDYFNRGIALLGRDRWQCQYDLTLALYQRATEAAYLSTDFEQMEQLAAVVQHHARSWLDRATIYESRIQACVAQSDYLEALRLAREVLEHLGVSLPEKPTQVQIAQALRQTQELLGDRPIESLLDLPEMTAPDKKAAMVILSSIMSAAYQVAPNLFPFAIFAQIALSVQYGNAPESAFGYVKYGLILATTLQDIDTGYRFGQLGINLLERIDTSKIAAKTIFGFTVFLRHLKEPVKDTLSGFLKAYSSGLETGDLEHIALSLMCYSYTAYFSGRKLSSLRQTMEDHRKVMRQFRQDGYLRMQSISYQAVLNLLEPTAEPDRLCSEYYDEDAMIRFHLEANQLLILCQIYLNKLLLSYLFQRYEQALENARLSERYLSSAAGLLHVPVFFFYDSLLQLAIYPSASEAEQISMLDRVAAHQEKLSQWAVHAPSNQAHRCALVAAERCRVLNQKAAAIDLYDRAIALAKANEYVNEEAIANELAAKFYLDWGKERIAQEYLTEAYYSYARWGAKAKIADLETRYPQLLAPILQQPRAAFSVSETVFSANTVTDTSSSSGNISDSLDLAVILKASQTLSSEIELGKLLSTLLQLIIENAGADKCVLMMKDGFQGDPTDERLLIKGIAMAGEEPVVLQHIPIEQSQDIPLKLIYRVKNYLEAVVLTNATADPDFVSDSYLLRQQPKSILCSPILHQGKLLGMAYLENSLVVGAFTEERVRVLNLLCAQATISLENARLYQRSQDYAKELEQSVAELNINKARWQRMTDNLPGLVYQVLSAADGSVSTPYMSSSCIALFEVSPEEIMTGAVDFRDMEHPDDRPAIEQGVRQATETLMPFEHEARIISASGKVKWIQTITRPERQADGSIVWDGLKIDITDRKQAEKSLKLTQFAIDHVCLPVWWIKPSGQLAYANEAACRDLGYSQIEILQRYVWDFDINLEVKNWERNWQRVKARGSSHFETQNINSSGEIYPVEVTLDYIALEGEEYQSAIVRNISDRKQAEQEQARLIAILEATTDIVGMADVRGNNLYLNQAGQRLLQIPAAEMNQFHISEVTANSMAEAMQMEILPTTMREGFWSGESIVRDRSGMEIPVSQVLMSHKNAQGEVEFLSTIMRDIRDRKQAEAELQEKEQFLRSIYDGAEMVIFVVNVSGDGQFRYAGWNAAAEKASGIRSANSVGKTPAELFGAKGMVMAQRLAECARTERSIYFEECLTFDEQESWWFSCLNPVKNTEGKIDRIIGTTFNISDRKRAETQLNQRTIELEQTLQELQRTQSQMIQSEKMSGLGQLVAGVAHEINNPVNFIYGNLNHADEYIQELLELLQLYQQHYLKPHPDIRQKAENIDLEFLTDDLPKLLASMKVGADRIKAIVASLRNFSRMDEAEVKPVDIHDGIDSTLMILQHRLKARVSIPEIEVIKAYGKLPPIECYAGQLNQVFMNLITNAIDALEESFSAGRTTAPTITIRTSLVNTQQVEIQIIDNGLGIPDHVKSRLFDPFFTTKPVGKGTGMGLSISYQIVTEKHQGTLQCISEPGQGSQFIVTIPVQQV